MVKDNEQQPWTMIISFVDVFGVFQVFEFLRFCQFVFLEHCLLHDW